LLAQCDGNLDEGGCGGTAVAFTLPSPGDLLELTVFVCGDADESVTIVLEVEMAGSQSRQVNITVDGGANVSVDQGTLTADVDATPATCETGLSVGIEHLDRGGLLTGVLHIVGYVESNRCEIRVEAS
jgi:hypothetical protein